MPDISARWRSFPPDPICLYAQDMLSEGELAPDFDVPAHDGSRVKLSDLAGKYVLLWFYPMADTPG